MILDNKSFLFNGLFDVMNRTGGQIKDLFAVITQKKMLMLVRVCLNPVEDLIILEMILVNELLGKKSIYVAVYG
jgi:hypothetical protein